MRVLAVLHRPTTDPAGAERMLHAMLKYLASVGHDVIVVPTAARGEGVTDHISTLHPSAFAEEMPKADIVITHLDATARALMAARRHKKPSVIVEHNTFMQHKQLTRRFGGANGLVFNSEWMAKDWGKIAPHLPRTVVHPPVNPDDYRTQRGDQVTLINLFKNGKLLWNLAERMPDVSFLAVRGGYGRQDQPTPLPPNVEVIDPTMDVVGDVYSRTRVLLIPSLYESWGRVAIEAASSGIPAIANPTPGLLEALGSAGTFCDATDLGAWEDAVRTLLGDSSVYDEYAGLATSRAAELWVTSQTQLAEFEAFLARLAG